MPLRPALVHFVVPLFAISLLCQWGCKDSHTRSTASAGKVIIGNSHDLFSEDEFIRKLSVAVPTVDTTAKRGVSNVSEGVRIAYSSIGHGPIWVDESGVSSFAKSLLDDLDSLRLDGINPERYHLSALKSSFQALSDNGGDIDAAIAFDTACTRSYLQASRDLLLGILIPKQGDSLWYHSNDSSWTAPQLLARGAIDGQYITLNTFRSKILTYNLLRQEAARYTEMNKNQALLALKASASGKPIADTLAIKIINKELPWIKPEAGDSVPPNKRYIISFQEYYGLNPTGKIDSTTGALLIRQANDVLPLIAANMERIRWMPQQMEDQYVLVDIPLMELFFRKGSQDQFHMRVVVGKPSRQTPVLNANMANVVFSPGWGVPATILKQDVLPGIQRRGGSYLAKKGLKAYDRHGRQVNASRINSHNYRNFNFKQAPGERNALGEVKFNLPNQWDIYLHDTPHREDFPHRYRAKSSGCIRVEKPKDFAAFILNDLEGRQFDPYKMDSIIGTRKTRFENLRQKIPVHILYLTAFEDKTGLRVHFIQDIYKRDDKLITVLRSADSLAF